MLFGMLALLAVAVWLAPIVVSRTSLCDTLLNAALGLNGKVTARSASLGWFSPVVLHDVKITAADGGEVMEITAVIGQKALLALAWNRAELGRFELTHPVVHADLREAGSNLEEVFAPLMERREDHAARSVELEVTDGVVAIHDRMANRHFQLENLALLFKSDSAGTAPLELEASGTLPTDTRPARFKVALQTGSAEGSNQQQTSSLVCHVDALPLVLLQPIVRRSLPGAQLAGRISTEANCRWAQGAEANEVAIEGDVVMTDLSVAADALGTDELNLERLEMPCQIAWRGGELEIKKLSVECDLGHMTVRGKAQLPQLTAAELLASVGKESYEVKGQLDLARLTQMLPATLRIREGTDITSGQLQWAVASQPQPTGMSWTGRLDIGNLTAISDGRPLEWTQPMTLQFAARQGEQGTVIEHARCTSNFLQLEARGTLNDLQATADFDLQRLMSELQQFVDLSDCQLAGQGHGKFEWKRPAGESFTATGELQASKFQLVVPGRRPWTEEKLNARLDAQGRLAGTALQQIERLVLRAEAGAERLSVELLQPLQEPAKEPWNVQLAWQGELADWLPRLESWIDLSAWELRGTGTFQGKLIYAPGQASVEGGQLQVQHFHVWGSGLYIDEPRLDAQVTARWEKAQNRFELSTGKVTAGKLNLDVEKANWTGGDGGALTIGAARYQAELAQLGRWLQDPRLARTWRLAGKATGQVAIRHSAGISQAEGQTTIEGLEIADLTAPRTAAPGGGVAANSTAAARVWRERQLALAAKADYDHAARLLRVHQSELVSDALTCRLSGKIASTAEVRNLDLQGQLDYDWQKLAPLWRPYLGDHVQLVGHETHQFALRGPWSGDTSLSALARLSGQASVGWDRIDVYGVQVGKGVAAAQWNDGLVQFRPLDVELSEGRLTLAPTVRLAPEPALLQLSKGALFHQVRINPEMCARGLKFIAPVLAEATIADGRISMELEGGRLPLANPRGVDAAGKLLVHSIEVKPGLLAQQLILLGKQIEAIVKRRPLEALTAADDALLKIEERSIDFRIVDGRVYHRGLQFAVGKATVTTYGSVGLDESLAIMAELPLPAAWLGNDPALAGLRGQVLQIPIEGTLKKPKIDRHAVEQLSAQLLRSAARGLIFDQLNKQLEKLLPVEQ